MLKFIDTASADEYFLVELLRRAAKITFNSLNTKIKRACSYVYSCRNKTKSLRRCLIRGDYIENNRQSLQIIFLKFLYI